MWNSSIWLLDRTLSGAITPGQSGPGNDGNEEVLRIPQSSNITGASPSDCLISYLGHSLRYSLLLGRNAVGLFNYLSRLGWFSLVRYEDIRFLTTSGAVSFSRYVSRTWGVSLAALYFRRSCQLALLCLTSVIEKKTMPSTRLFLYEDLSHLTHKLLTVLTK